ncbi:MAG: hypothetical protein KGR26_16580 [Cyanobacteria bacterium REEB65]|nr:hypothetical protein [Cyanobacteria bacterium REEB65]
MQQFQNLAASGSLNPSQLNGIVGAVQSGGSNSSGDSAGSQDPQYQIGSTDQPIGLPPQRQYGPFSDPSSSGRTTDPAPIPGTTQPATMSRGTSDSGS